MSADVVAVILALCVCSSGDEPLRLRPDGGRHELGPYLDVIEDPEGGLGIEDVTTGDAHARFERNTTEVLSRGVSASQFWLRFTVQAPAGATDWVLDVGRPVYFFDLELYVPTAEAGWNIHAIDPSIAPRPAFARGDTLPLELPESRGEPVTVYLRVLPRSSMFMPVAVYSPSDFLAKARATMWWFGTYVGVVLALIFYSLILFGTLRDRVYLYYVLYIGSMGLYALGIDGVTFEYLLPANPELARRVTLGALGMSAVGVLLFSRDFLDTPSISRKLDRVLITSALVSGAFVAAVPFAPFAALNRLIASWGQLFLPLLIALAVWNLVRGARHVRFYLLAFLSVFVAMSVYGMTFLGWLPFTWWGYYGFQPASALEAILLSFALAERIQALRAEGERLRRSERQYLEQSRTDALTGLSNRRRFNEAMPRFIEEAETEHQPLSLLLIDVDDFKRLNDTFGHPAGDELLARLGRIILSSTRGADAAFRYGGEEFVVALPSTPLERAETVAERIREAFGDVIVQPRQGSALRVTVSIGAAAHVTGERIESLVERADEAMYQAKANGKNRTVLAKAPTRTA